MFALNRTQFSGWIIADQLGAIRRDRMAEEVETTVAAEAAQRSQRSGRKPFTGFSGLLQPHPLAVWAIFGLLRR